MLMEYLVMNGIICAPVKIMIICPTLSIGNFSYDQLLVFSDFSDQNIQRKTVIFVLSLKYAENDTS